MLVAGVIALLMQTPTEQIIYDYNNDYEVESYVFIEEEKYKRLPFEPIDNGYYTSIKKEYVNYAIEVGEQYNISPSIIIAIIEKESGGDPNANATSGSGAVGLCQIKPFYQEERCKRLKVYSLYNPYSNILVCADYLKELINKYEDINLVLTAYRYGDNSYEFENVKKTGYSYDYVKDITNRSDNLQMWRYQE